MRLLLEAGAELEMASWDGRTALYLAAEFCASTKPVEFLLQCNADPKITNAIGVSIVENARSEKVRRLLAHTISCSPSTKSPAPKERRLPTAEWREVRKRLARVFDSLNEKGLVAFQGIGENQDAGFEICADEFRERGGRRAGWTGACFTSRSDERLARETGHLYIAYWGAPKGAEQDMLRVGRMILAELQTQELVVKWNETSSERLLVLLAEKS